MGEVELVRDCVLDEPIKAFRDQAAWTKWLGANHTRSKGVWLRLSKKGSDIPSVSYAEALEVALCYGWIDGQRRPESADAWLLRFLPRAPQSLWSRRNREKALELIEAGVMEPAGLRSVEAAKESGRWDAAYDPPSTSTIPPDLQHALEANPAALTFYGSLNRANQYAILWRIQTARKPETRARKITEIVAMLLRKEMFHSPRR